MDNAFGPGPEAEAEAAATGVVVKRTQSALAAFMSAKGPYTQIPAAISRLYKWIREKGYVPCGPASTLYLNVPGQVPEEALLWEVQVPLAGIVAVRPPDDEGMGVRRRESVQVAARLHKGPFETIKEAYDALISWITSGGYDIVSPAEEVYLTDPSGTREEELLTEVRIPVRKK